MVEYDIKIGEYTATAMTGEEVYGQTAAECEARLREANRVWIEHCKKNARIWIDNSVQSTEISHARIIGGDDGI